MDTKLDPPRAGVRFAPDFLDRLGRLVVQVSSARERREGAGRARLVGAGTEFVGFRPYRPGDDLRRLDWSLFARLRRPYVRLARRESSEHWAILLDTSASMGVGRPSKLQTAAEVATALAAVGLREGALVVLFLSAGGEPFRLRRRSDIGAWMRYLEGVTAAGERGLGALTRDAARLRDAGAVFLVGDLLDLEPAQLLALGRRGRDLHGLRILAAEEMTPRAEGPVRWVDPETGRARDVELDGETLAAYEHVVAGELERWGNACARHRIFYGSWSSGVPFETVVLAPFED